MAVFYQKPLGYKAGVLILCTGAILYLVGFSSPNWSEFTLDVTVDIGYSPQTVSINGYHGLWKSCVKHVYVTSMCSDVDNHGWRLGVVVTMCIGIVTLAVCLASVLILNCKKTAAVNRVVEVIAAYTGISTIGSEITYAIRMHDDINDFNDAIPDDDLDFSKHHLSWAFGLCMAGSVLMVISAVVIAVYNKPVVVPPPSATMTTLSPVAGAVQMGGVPGAAQPAYVYQYPGAGNPYVVPAGAPPAYPGTAPGEGQGQVQASGFQPPAFTYNNNMAGLPGK